MYFEQQLRKMVKQKLPILLPILFFLILLITFLNSVNGENERITVVIKVVDGDTFHIPGDSVRLADVDTQEISEKGYREAKEYLTSLIYEKTCLS